MGTVICKECGKITPEKYSDCIFCGYEDGLGSVFRSIISHAMMGYDWVVDREDFSDMINSLVDAARKHEGAK
jgi:hypothetical protein